MSVQKYRDGQGRVRWRVSYAVAPHPDGRRRTSTKRGFATRKAAVGWEDDLRGRRAAGDPPTPVDRETVGAYLSVWVEALALKATTVAGYRMVIRAHLAPHLGGYRLSALTPEHIDACYRLLERQGGRRGQGLAPKTVLNAHRVLHRALSDAVQRRRIPRNPASLAHPPSTRVAVTGAAARNIWTPDQLRVWLAHVRSDRLYGAWLLLATTGLRRGELAGLTWDAVDLDVDGGQLEVRQQLTLAANRMVFVPSAKTPKGWRTVSLDPNTCAALRSMRAHQFRERLLCGPAYQDHGLVVCWPDGSPMNPERLRRRLQVAAAALGLPRVNVQGLRHSYATAALRAGVSPEVLAERVGHADVATTLRVYAHVRRSDDVEAAARAARWITG